MAWLKTMFDMLCEIGSCAEGMSLAFFVDQAVGRQLDIIGSWVGASRDLSGSWGDSLSDTDYRPYIKAKILCNMWDGTNESLPGMWQAIYPNLQMSFVDGQDMTMTVTVTGDISVSLSAMIQLGLIIPCPSGVHQTYVVNTSTIETAEISMDTGLYEFGEDGFPNQGE